MTLDQSKYHHLPDTIGNTIQGARFNAANAINTELIKANWEIGRHIVEYDNMAMSAQNTEATCYQYFLKI